MSSVPKHYNEDICSLLCNKNDLLLCCEGCPSAIDLSCLGLQDVPSENKWYCNWCRCKFCGLHDEIGTTDNPNFGCIFLSCKSCRQKYHETCVHANNDETDDFNRQIICGKRCQEISQRLDMLLGKNHQIGDGFSCSFLHKLHDADSSVPKLNVALSLMHECFLPILVDFKDDKIEMLPNMLFSQGSNSPRISYTGFFTVTLEEGENMISAATIRVHDGMAEMPFIGTRSMYRGQGMCRKLFNVIEAALSYLNVETLVIPSAPNLAPTWISSFGFEPIDMAMKNQIQYKMVKFHDVKLLQKKIQKHNLSDESLSFIEVFNFHKNQQVGKADQEITNIHGERSSGRGRGRGRGRPRKISSTDQEIITNRPGERSLGRGRGRPRKRTSTCELQNAGDGESSLKRVPNSK